MAQINTGSAQISGNDSNGRLNRHSHAARSQREVQQIIVPVTPICAYPNNLRNLRSKSVATLRRETALAGERSLGRRSLRSGFLRMTAWAAGYDHDDALKSGTYAGVFQYEPSRAKTPA